MFQSIYKKLNQGKFILLFKNIKIFLSSNIFTSFKNSTNIYPNSAFPYTCLVEKPNIPFFFHVLVNEYFVYNLGEFKSILLDDGQWNNDEYSFYRSKKPLGKYVTKIIKC